MWYLYAARVSLPHGVRTTTGSSTSMRSPVRGGCPTDWPAMTTHERGGRRLIFMKTWCATAHEVCHGKAVRHHRRTHSVRRGKRSADRPQSECEAPTRFASPPQSLAEGAMGSQVIRHESL